MTIDPSTTETDSETTEQSTLRPKSHQAEVLGSVGGDKSEPEVPPALAFALPGVLLAIVCYLIMVEIVLLAWSPLLPGFARSSSELFVRLLFFSVIVLVGGLIYGVIVSLLSLLLKKLLCHSLTGILSDRGASGIYGGLTGFLCVSGGGLYYCSGIGFFGEWFPLLVFASLLAIIMGHGGAILAGYCGRHNGFPFFEPIFFKKQITIGFLMNLTLIVAVLSFALRAAGVAGLYVGIAWLVYLVVQAILLVIDHWITCWLGRSNKA